MKKKKNKKKKTQQLGTLTSGSAAHVTGAGPEQMREEHIGYFVASAKKAFELDDEIRSAMLSVSQYYCDEASDAVHGTMTFSSRAAPGPYVAPTARPKPKKLDYLRWDSNWAGILGFVAFCSEVDDEAPPYRPYAVARKSETGVVVELVGNLARPWDDLGSGYSPMDGDFDPTSEENEDDEDEAAPPAAEWPIGSEPFLKTIRERPLDDGPRAVFSDWLLSKNDPRGELIALQLHERTPEVQAALVELEERRFEWLGVFAAIVPRSAFVVDRGFLDVVGVFTKKVDKEAAWFNSEDWATLRVVYFFQGSATFVTPTMRGAQYLGPLDAKGLDDLAKLAGAGPTQLRVLDVDLEEAKMVEQLVQMRVPPTLKVLRLRDATKTAVAQIAKAPWFKQLDRLELAASALSVFAETRAMNLGVEVVWSEIDDAGDVSGFRLAMEPGAEKVFITRVGYTVAEVRPRYDEEDDEEESAGGDPLDVLWDSAKLLKMPFVLSPSWAWDPNQADVAALAKKKVQATLGPRFEPDPIAHPTRSFMGTFVV